MPVAAVSSLGLALKARFEVNGIQSESRSVGVVMAENLEMGERLDPPGNRRRL
jgi:hypothetical protein